MNGRTFSRNPPERGKKPPPPIFMIQQFVVAVRNILPVEV